MNIEQQIKEAELKLRLCESNATTKKEEDRCLKQFKIDVLRIKEADVQPMFKDTDKILVHRDGVDYQAELGPLIGGGGGGDSTNCNCPCPAFTAGSPSPNPKDGYMFTDTQASPPKLYIFSEACWPGAWVEYGKGCPASLPWRGHDGGIIHFRNDSQSSSIKLWEGPFQMWDPDGTNEEVTDTIPAGATKVMAVGTDCHDLFEWKSNFSILPQYTDVSRVTNMEGMFEASRPNEFNPEGWSVCNVTCMKKMFHNMDNWVFYDLTSWGVENCPDPKWEDDWNNAFKGEQPLWGEPNGPCQCKESIDSAKLDEEEKEWKEYLKKKRDKKKTD
jgi:hypothetical protein